MYFPLCSFLSMEFCFNNMIVITILPKKHHEVNNKPKRMVVRATTDMKWELISEHEHC